MTWYMLLIQFREVRINHLTTFLVVTMPYACRFLWWTEYIEDFKWCLHFQFGVAYWRVALREEYFEKPNRIWRALKTSILNTEWWWLICVVCNKWMTSQLCSVCSSPESLECAQFDQCSATHVQHDLDTGDFCVWHLPIANLWPMWAKLGFLFFLSFMVSRSNHITLKYLT